MSNPHTTIQCYTILDSLYFFPILKKKMVFCNFFLCRIVTTMATLFWSLFGLIDTKTIGLGNLNHTFTQGVGNVMFATYHIIAIVVLLNVLIAMMSNTYTRVEVSFLEPFNKFITLNISFFLHNSRAHNCLK